MFVPLTPSVSRGQSTGSDSRRIQASSVTTPGPTNLAYTLSGSPLTLTWAAGTGASSYQLQAGSSSGRVDLADRDLLSPATSLVAPNVGVGTYFVRVRSNNSCGQSAPSNEVVVIIR